ncbi:MAG: alpha/beta hydrolase, partial [Bradyrhizobium sp.]
MSTATLPRRPLLLSLLTLRSYPGTRKPWLYALARLAVLGAYLYLVVMLALLALEDRLLFNVRTAADYWDEPPSGLDPQDVEIVSGDGTRLHGWWSAPPYWTPEQGALLYLHGNACNLSTLGLSAMVWREQLNVAVLLIDYPGFGRSAGSPSEAGLYAAGDAAYDWLVNEKKVPPKRLLIHGLSLGGGVVVDLASRRPHRALILTSTFTSFPDEAQAVVQFAPGKWLVHNQFRNIDKIARIKTPV